MKPLNDSLPKIVDSGVSNVSYDKDSLLKSLTEETIKPKTPLGKVFLFPFYNLSRFFLLITTAIVTITIVLTFSITYFKDILLFKSNLSVNKQGVFMPSKSCGREYCLFLFNTSELWANTGIYLNKGDKYKMSVSGAFHSSVEDLRNNAQINNSNPDINWIGGKQRNELSDYLDSVYRLIEYENNACYRSFHRKPVMHTMINDVFPQYEKHAYCVDTNAYFGAILYRIAPEYQLWDPDNNNDTILVWGPNNGKTYQTVESSGVLSMAINDIYFKDTAFLGDYCRSFPYRFESKPMSFDSVMKYDMGREAYKTMFYDDNIGQILVCLEIQHPLYWGFFDPLSPFRYLDTALELKSEDSSDRLQMFVKAIPDFIVFAAYIFALFVIYIGIALITVYFLFLLGYWLYKLGGLIIKTYERIIA